MPYNITKSDGTVIFQLADGLVDTAHASIKFIGKNVSNYGEIQNDNLLWMLEHFAKSTPPTNQVNGQLWFDSTSGVARLKLYADSQWRQLPTVAINATAPTGQAVGDLWWDTTNNQLLIWGYGDAHQLIGPNYTSLRSVRLDADRTINGKIFNGTANIEISSTTTNYISTGSYLLGTNFNGSSPSTWSVDVGRINYADAFKVVARDSAGDIWFTTGHGTSTQSKYADLAEKYLADKEYDVGTVVAVGGEKEVTASAWGDRAIGVVSGKPGYMMNSELEGGTYIALKGRVPVKVTGVIRKKQGLIAANNGRAMAGVYHSNEVFAIALEDSDGTKDTIEAIIL
jgi:hypothetical protein